MFLVVFSVLLVLALVVIPVCAINNGELDFNGHPYVGLVVAQDGNGERLWRCSGTLLSPTLFLTAGHCTYGAVHMEIWFDADVESGIPANGYPFNGDVGGTPYTHPDYNDNAFYLRDVGLVKLDEPIDRSEYGTLPQQNQLDAPKTKGGKQNQIFTAVGYGLQESFPDAAAWKENNVKVRMVARPRLIQINVPGTTGDFSIILSNNANTGGTCFGDSGGPNFIGNTTVVGGVTSFGKGTCAGNGGVFRMDRSWSLDWVRSFMFD